MSSFVRCLAYLELLVYTSCHTHLLYLCEILLLLGRHCCLYCEITADQLKVPPEKRGAAPQLRTLDSLRADYNRFVAEGGNIKRAKFHNNVILPFYFDIPLDQVITEWSGLN